MSESMVPHCLPKGLKVQDKVPNSILELDKKKRGRRRSQGWSSPLSSLGLCDIQVSVAIIADHLRLEGSMLQTMERDWKRCVFLSFCLHPHQEKTNILTSHPNIIIHQVKYIVLLDGVSLAKYELLTSITLLKWKFDFKFWVINHIHL